LWRLVVPEEREVMMMVILDNVVRAYIGTSTVQYQLPITYSIVLSTIITGLSYNRM
jgi:hypothetical protein